MVNNRHISSKLYKHAHSLHPQSESWNEQEAWLRNVFLPAHNKMAKTKAMSVPVKTHPSIAGKKRGRGQEDASDTLNKRFKVESGETTSSSPSPSPTAFGAGQKRARPTNKNGSPHSRQINTDSVVEEDEEEEEEAQPIVRVKVRGHARPAVAGFAEKPSIDIPYTQTHSYNDRLRDHSQLRLRLRLGEYFTAPGGSTVKELADEYGLSNTNVRSAAKSALKRYYNEGDTGIFWATEWIKQHHMILLKYMTPKVHVGGSKKISSIPKYVEDLKMAMHDCMNAWKSEQADARDKKSLAAKIRARPAAEPILPATKGARAKVREQISLILDLHPYYAGNAWPPAEFAPTTASESEPDSASDLAPKEQQLGTDQIHDATQQHLEQHLEQQNLGYQTHFSQLGTSYGYGQQQQQHTTPQNARTGLEEFDFGFNVPNQTAEHYDYAHYHEEECVARQDPGEQGGQEIPVYEDLYTDEYITLPDDEAGQGWNYQV